MKTNLVLLTISAVVFVAQGRGIDVVPLSSVHPRIVGGIAGHPEQFPYMVHLRSDAGSCGSSIISDEYLLTAAHCVRGVDEVHLLFGVKDLSNNPEEGRIEMTSPKENIIMHEKYSRTEFENDIALIKLPQKITFRRDIKPVRLPSRSEEDLAGNVALVTGWGIKGPEGSSNVILYAQLRIFAQEVCKKRYSVYYHPSNICLDGGKQSPCHGDSGGPAVIVDRNDRQLTQVGIASYVSPYGCMQGHPVAYTRVSSFLDWIHEKTGITIRD